MSLLAETDPLPWVDPPCSLLPPVVARVVNADDEEEEEEDEGFIEQPELPAEDDFDEDDFDDDFDDDFEEDPEEEEVDVSNVPKEIDIGDDIDEGELEFEDDE